MILTILKRFIIPKIYLEIRVSWTGAEEIIRPMNIVLKQSKKKPAYMCGLFVFLYLDLLLLFYRNICCQITMRWFNINKIIIQHMKSAKKEFNSFCFYFAIRIQHDLHTIAMWCSINS